MKPKQVIVMRKDLKMRKGKMVAQGAHASIKVLLDLVAWKSEDRLERHIKLPSLDMADWIDGSFTKICLGAESEEELDALYALAQSKGLPCALIIDNGLTEFNGVKTKTCIAIGPADGDLINEVTGALSPL